MARAVLESVPMSYKSATMIARTIKNMELKKAQELLKHVIEKKKAIRFTRYNQEQAHRPNIGPGRYPIKAARLILKLLEEVEANAQYLGLDTSSLTIIHVSAKKASSPYHYGRRRGIEMKRSTIEVVVSEYKQEEKKKKGKKERKDKEKGKEEKSSREKEKKETEKGTKHNTTKQDNQGNTKDKNKK